MLLASENVANCLCSTLWHSALYNTNDAPGHAGLTVKSQSLITCTASIKSLPPDYLPDLSRSWSIHFQSSLTFLMHVFFGGVWFRPAALLLSS